MRYCTLLFLLLSFPCGAQTVQGVVKDASTGKPLWPATVINVFSQQSTATDKHGLYTISAKQGDVIAYTYIGYKTVEKVTPPSVLFTTINVSMEQSGYQLQDFNLRPGHLTPYQMDSMERKSTYKVPLRRTHPNPVMSPFSALAEKFSKSAKRTYAFQKDFYRMETEHFIDTRYSADLVASLTGATGDSIGHFMYAYPMPYDYARTATDLEIKMWIRFNYKAWLKEDSAHNATTKREAINK